MEKRSLLEQIGSALRFITSVNKILKDADKTDRKSRSFWDTSSPVRLDETHFSNIGPDFAHNYFDGSYVTFLD